MPATLHAICCAMPRGEGAQSQTVKATLGTARARSRRRLRARRPGTRDRARAAARRLAHAAAARALDARARGPARAARGGGFAVRSFTRARCGRRDRAARGARGNGGQACGRAPRVARRARVAPSPRWQVSMTCSRTISPESLVRYVELNEVYHAELVRLAKSSDTRARDRGERGPPVRCPRRLLIVARIAAALARDSDRRAAPAPRRSSTRCGARRDPCGGDRSRARAARRAQPRARARGPRRTRRIRCAALAPS